MTAPPVPRFRDTPMFAPATSDASAKVLVIAELGVNHDGRLDRALEMVDAAAHAGADAIKLQMFHPDRLLSNQARLAAYQSGAARNAGSDEPTADDVRAMLGRLTLDVEALRAVRRAADRAGLAFIVTPFSVADVDEAAGLDLDAVKIASPDAVNLLLIRKAATLDLPLLISTGTCSVEELSPAADLLRRHPAGGCLLQCVSSYPTPTASAALGGIAALRSAVSDTPTLAVGYSDHTTALSTGGLAVAAGAVVLEKHLTHDRRAPGPDHAASLDPARFADYVRGAREAAAMLGPIRKVVLPVEAEVREVSRQSVCAADDLPAGRRLGREDLTLKRPGTGIPAAALDEVIGRTLARAVACNDLLKWQDLTGVVSLAPS